MIKEINSKEGLFTLVSRRLNKKFIISSRNAVFFINDEEKKRINGFIFSDKFKELLNGHYTISLNGEEIKTKDVNFVEIFPESMVVGHKELQKGISIGEKITIYKNLITHNLILSNKTDTRKRVNLRVDLNVSKSEENNSRIDTIRNALVLKSGKNICYFSVKGVEKEDLTFKEEKRIKEKTHQLGYIEISTNVSPHSSKTVTLLATDKRDIFDEQILNKKPVFYDPYELDHSVFICPSQFINRLYFWAVRELKNNELDINRIEYLNKVIFGLRKNKIKKKNIDGAITEALRQKNTYDLVALLIYLEDKNEINKITSILEELSYDIITRNWNPIDALFIYAFVIKFIESLFLKRGYKENELLIDYRIPHSWPFMELHNVIKDGKNIDIVLNRVEKGHNLRLTYYSEDLKPFDNPIDVKIFKNPEIRKMRLVGIKTQPEPTLKDKVKSIIRAHDLGFILKKNSYVEIDCYY